MFAKHGPTLPKAVLVGPNLAAKSGPTGLNLAAKNGPPQVFCQNNDQYINTCSPLYYMVAM